MDARWRSIAWLGHPVTVLALVLLVVNDHVLKAAHPGWVTGKLSDAAGMVLAPPLLAVLLARWWPRHAAAAALATVGLGFTAVKASASGAALASTAWSVVNGPSVILADPADLLALPFLAVSWWAWRSSSEHPYASPLRRRRSPAPCRSSSEHPYASPGGPRRSHLPSRRSSEHPCASPPAGTRSRIPPVPARWVRLFRVGVLLPGALLGVAATSAPLPPEVAIRVAATPDALYLISESRYERWVASLDGGATWWSFAGLDPSDPAAGPSALPGLDPPPSPPPAPPEPPAAAPAQQACSDADPASCYRIVPGALAVERSADAGATWAVDWQVGDRERRLLAGQYDEIADVEQDLRSVAVAVQDRPGGGHVVVVANRRDGFALRDAAGTWTRLGFPDQWPEPAPVPELGRPAGEHLAFAAGLTVTAVAFMVAMVVTTGAAWAAWRTRGRAGWWFAPAGLLVTVPPLEVLALGGTSEFPLYPFLLLGPLIGVVGSAVVAAVATSRVHGGVPGGGGWALTVWAAGSLTGILGCAVWFLWFADVLPGWVAASATPVACVPGVLLAVRAARSLPPPVPDTWSPGSYGSWTPSPG